MNKGEDPLLEHYSAVRSFLARFIRQPDVAEDLTQDTFIRAYGWMERHQRQPDRPYSWLHSIARNVAADYCKSERDRVERLELHQRLRGEDWYVAEARTLEDLVRREEEATARGTAKQALSALSDLDRELVTGYYLREQGCAYLGRSTGVGRKTVKVRLHRARKKMREALEAEEDQVNGDAL